MKKTIVVFLTLLSIGAFAGNAPLPAELMQAKTVYIISHRIQDGRVLPDPSGDATYVDACRDELAKWGRFKVVSDPKEADLIFRIGSRVQTSYMVINNQSRKEGNGVTFLEVVQTSSGKVLWSGTHNWAWSWSVKSARTVVVKQLRKSMEEQEVAECKDK